MLNSSSKLTKKERKFTFLYLANVLKLLSDRVLVLIANVVKEGKLLEIKTARLSGEVPDSEKAKDQIPFPKRKSKCICAYLLNISHMNVRLQTLKRKMFKICEITVLGF